MTVIIHFREGWESSTNPCLWLFAISNGFHGIDDRGSCVLCDPLGFCSFSHELGHCC